MMELANRSRAAGKVKLADGSRATSKVGVAKRKPRPADNIFGNCQLQQLAALLKIPAPIF